jgi:hypothetical protein
MQSRAKWPTGRCSRPITGGISLTDDITKVARSAMALLSLDGAALDREFILHVQDEPIGFV